MNSMLGYTLQDLNNMIDATGIALHYLPENGSNEDARKSLELTHDFLQGLWAEGYFD